MQKASLDRLILQKRESPERTHFPVASCSQVLERIHFIQSCYTNNLLKLSDPYADGGELRSYIFIFRPRSRVALRRKIKWRSVGSGHKNDVHLAGQLH